MKKMSHQKSLLATQVDYLLEEVMLSPAREPMGPFTLNPLELVQRDTKPTDALGGDKD